MHKIALILIILALNSTIALADDTKYILACIGEAEGEIYQGKVAVCEAIRNRGTLKGVYGLNAPRIKKHLYSKKTFNDCKRAWIESEYTNITKGATHWEGTAFKTPYWAKNMTLTATIGNQRFYK